MLQSNNIFLFREYTILFSYTFITYTFDICFVENNISCTEIVLLRTGLVSFIYDKFFII